MKDMTVALMQEELAPIIFSLNNAKDTIKEVCHTVRSIITETCGLTQEEFIAAFGKDENDPRWTGMVKILTNYGNILSDPRLLSLIVEVVNKDKTPLDNVGGDTCPY